MASTQKTSASIIKSNSAGRTRYSQAYKDEVVAAYQQSGMNAAAFADHRGVKYPTFVSWVSKVMKAGSAHTYGRENSQQFILVQMGCGQADVPLEIELPGGIIAQVSSS